MARQKAGLRIRLTKNMVSGRSSFSDISFNQEHQLMKAIERVINTIFEKPEFANLTLEHEKSILLNTIISQLKEMYQNTDFTDCFDNSSMRPDGGITYLVDKNNNRYPILIAEKKNQGTNDLRNQEGLRKQAKGNAVERLGKNVIGLKTYTMGWNIFPFVCFGDGCDFAEDSSIIDRVKTIAMFGNLNKEYLTPTDCFFFRGSYYFRRQHWTEEEMYSRCLPVAEKSIYHYFSLFGKEYFA